MVCVLQTVQVSMELVQDSKAEDSSMLRQTVESLIRQGCKQACALISFAIFRVWLQHLAFAIMWTFYRSVLAASFTYIMRRS